MPLSPLSPPILPRELMKTKIEQLPFRRPSNLLAGKKKEIANLH